MNQRNFRRNVFLVIAVYGATIAVGIGLKLFDPSNKDAPVYGTFKDLVPLFIVIPAAWLSYCFQRRQAYLKDVRDLWSKLVGAVKDAIQYTHLNTPDQADFGRVLKTRSATTEEVRAVFANVGKDEFQIGLYPFEGIKAIHNTISHLGFGSPQDPNAASNACKSIVDQWKELRTNFLLELERGAPERPHSPFLN
jgi:hypothetical protein